MVQQPRDQSRLIWTLLHNAQYGADCRNEQYDIVFIYATNALRRVHTGCVALLRGTATQRIWCEQTFTWMFWK